MRRRVALLALSLIAALPGCDGAASSRARPATTGPTTTAATESVAQFARFDDFEADAIASFWLSGDYGAGRYEPGAIALTAERARSGSRSVRIIVNEGDIKQVGGDGKDTERAELDSGKHPFIGQDVWYGFSVLVPPDFPIADNRLVIAQWKQSDAPGGPLVAQRFRDGRHTITVRAHNDKRYDLPELKTGRWHDMIYHICFSPGRDGLLEVWMNGKQVVDAKGPVTISGGGDRIYNKIGLYRDRLKQPMTIYFDNYALANRREAVDPARLAPQP